MLAADRGAARERFGIAPGARCLLVMGGSQGARSINECALAALAERPGRDFDVVHLAGRRDFDSLRERLAAAPHDERYTLLAYEPDLGDCLAACDLVLGRSGGSIFELTAAGRPAILVPYPHAAAGHQESNAAWMAERRRGDGDPRRASSTPSGSRARSARCSATGAAWREMSAASAALAMPDAARTIADQVLAAVRS